MSKIERSRGIFIGSMGNANDHTGVTEMSLSCWPEGYGYTFTRPVNWDEGAMTQEDARLLSKEHSRRTYVVVWEGKDEKIAFRKGVQQWRTLADNH